MDVSRRDQLYTIDDIYALPDGVRAELVDGKIYSMALPSRTHQKLQHFFDRTIGNYIEPKIPTNYTQVYDEISTNKQFISDILQK